MVRTFDSRRGQKWNPPRSPDLELNQQLDELLPTREIAALSAWREHCYRQAEGAYFDAKPFLRAVQFGDAWAVKGLQDLGEVATPQAVLRCLDACADTVQGGRDSPTFVRCLDAWHALLDTAVSQRLDLKIEAIGFVASLRSVLPGPGSEEDTLDWEQMRLGEVFTPDTWQAAVPWRGSNDLDPEAYLRPDVKLSPLQLAWASQSWEVCVRLLEAGLPLRASFPHSCWPAWTLKAALSGKREWLVSLEGMALADALAVLKKNEELPQDNERLRAWVRAADLEEGLPVGSSSQAWPRF